MNINPILAADVPWLTVIIGVGAVALVFFIFPSIGIVIIVPAAISILESLKHIAD